MIDEELYKRAADELNSERRRPHIWARACALANDDHDEARYLYTNLRVEELLAEQAAGDATASVPATDTEALSLEPLETERTDGDAATDEAAFEPPASRRAGLDAAPSEPLSLPATSGTRPASERDRLTLELDEERPFGLDPSEVARENDAQREPISAIDGRRITPAEVVGESRPEDGGRTSMPAGDDGGAREAGSAVSLDALDPDAARPIDSTPLDDGFDAAAPERPAAAAETSRADATDEHGRVVSPRAARTSSASDLDPLDLGDLGRDERERAAPARPSGGGGASDDDDPLDAFFSEVAAGGSAARSVAGEPGELSWLDEEYRDEQRAAEAPTEALDPPETHGADGTPAAERRTVRPRPGGSPARAGTDGDPATEALAREFERQADELPVGRDEESAVIAHEAREEGERPLVASGAGDVASASGMALGSGDEVYDGEPLELADEGSAREEYAVFARPGSRSQSVRQGSSWGALVATLPWLLYRHLVGTAIVYALFASTVLAGLAASGFAWLDAGAAAPWPTRAAFVAFAVLAVVGLLVVPFRRANHWREDKLERRGFDLIAYVRANSAERARELAERAVDAPR